MLVLIMICFCYDVISFLLKFILYVFVIISLVNDIGCWKNKEGRDYKLSDLVKILMII